MMERSKLLLWRQSERLREEGTLWRMRFGKRDDGDLPVGGEDIVWWKCNA